MKKFLFLLLLIPFMAHGFIGQRYSGNATTTSAKVLNADLERKYLLIQNRGVDSIYLKIESAHSGTEGIVISAGGNYESEMPIYNEIWLKSASGSQPYEILTGN